MTPGFDEAVVEIKNNDGRYQIICVCRFNCYLFLQLVQFTWDSGMML